MKRQSCLCGLWLLFCVGCATPTEVKQATTALDKAYADNAQLMHQYRETLESLHELHHNWTRYVLTRELLSLSLELASIDQTADVAKLPARVKRLGVPIVDWIKSHRLKGLPAQSDFPAGTVTVGQLLEALPGLVFLIRQSVDASMALEVISKEDYSAFDKYASDVATLQAANAAVKQYLDIDVTVSGNDVKEIAAGLAALQGKK